MIRADKHPAIERLFARINRAMFRRHFHAMHLRGGENVARLDRNLPIIFYGNHSNWWDGLLQFFLSTDVFGFDSYLMMDELQLRRYRFFRWIGVFSVDRAAHRGILASIGYAAGLFVKPNRVLWIYPQADMRPNDVRPLRFFGGIARVLELAGKAQVIPIAHRYEFLMEQRPEIFIAVGEPEIVDGVRDRRMFLRDLEMKLTRLLDDVRGDVIGGRMDDYAVILRGRRSTNVTYDDVRRKGLRA